MEINNIYKENTVEFYNIDTIDERLGMMKYPKNPLEQAQKLMIDMDIIPNDDIHLNRRDYTKEVLYELFGKKVEYMYMTSYQFINIINYTMNKISTLHRDEHHIRNNNNNNNYNNNNNEVKSDSI
jgi:hypothetical protein